jgi:hypothetical protein
MPKSQAPSMSGSWYSVVSHATVSGTFTQTGSSITGSVGWANYGIGSFNWNITGSVNGSAFSLVGRSLNSGPFPAKAKFTGQITSDGYGPGLAVNASPFGSYMFRPSGALANGTKAKKTAAKSPRRRKSA